MPVMPSSAPTGMPTSRARGTCRSVGLTRMIGAPRPWAKARTVAMALPAPIDSHRSLHPPLPLLQARYLVPRAARGPAPGVEHQDRGSGGLPHSGQRGKSEVIR